MPVHLLAVLSTPLLDDVVLGRVQIGSRGLCLEPVHFSQEVLVELDLADVFEEGEIAGGGVVGACFGCLGWFLLRLQFVLLPPFLWLGLDFGVFGFDAILNEGECTRGL
jgi:hypothetical protein